MVAVSLNGALGNAGLLLVLAAATVGALSTGVAIITGNGRGVRQAPVYAWLMAVGALLAVFAMQRALETRDYTLRLHPAGRLQQHARHLQRRRDVERARGLDPAVGRRARGVHRRRRVAVPQAARRLARGLGTRGDVRGGRVLRAARVRPGQPVRGRRRRCRRRSTARARTRCCRTTSSCCSTRRSCTSATSGSPCRSRSRSAALITGRVGEGWLHGDAPVGTVRMGFPHRRHPARRVVELRGARVVGRVGLGPGGERVAPAVAHRHRLHPLGARAAASRHAPRAGTSACSSPRSRSRSSAPSSHAPAW